MNKKTVLFLIICLGVGFRAHGQLAIEDCYEKARLNFPQIQQYDLIEQSKEYNLQNASRGYLPQFSLSAKATYQTDVTKIPISMPGVTIPTINKDQYQAVAEVNQVIWDGGAIRSQKDIIRADYEVKQSQYEVDMYALHERVNEIFFGILVVEEQIVLNDIFNDELKANYDKVLSSISKGTANQADLDVVRVEILNTSQRQTELEALRSSYLNILSYLIGKPSGKDLQIVKPDMSTLTQLYDLSINDNTFVNARPEIPLYQANVRQLEAQKQNITANNLPKLSLIIQGGYGNPGLNMFETGFKPYAVGGIKLSWNFGGLYTVKNDKRKIDNNIQKISVQQDVFNFNARIKTIQQQTEINKYLDIISDDEEIIRLRENIKKASEAKVENGTMNVNDLVRDISAEQTARRNKALHEIEMIKAVYQLKNTLNK